jgi:hypothetical protein
MCVYEMRWWSGLACRSCGRSLCLGDACLSMVSQADNSTPLYVASKGGHLNVVKALLRAGAAVNEATVRDDGLHTCRMLATGRWPCMRAVIRDAYVEGSFVLVRVGLAWRVCV